MVSERFIQGGDSKVKKPEYPTFEDLRKALMDRANRFSQRSGKSLGLVSRLVSPADKGFLIRVQKGEGFNVKKYQSVMERFDELENGQSAATDR